jgi:hypothetical protein
VTPVCEEVLLLGEGWDYLAGRDISLWKRNLQANLLPWDSCVLLHVQGKLKLQELPPIVVHPFASIGLVPYRTLILNSRKGHFNDTSSTNHYELLHLL